MIYPITSFNPPKLKSARVLKESYFPNHKTEMLVKAFEDTKDLRYYQKAIEYSVRVMMGMVHTHKFYSVHPEDMRSHGAFTASSALRSFDPEKPFSSSLFSYLSLAFYKASMTIRTDVSKWESKCVLFEDLEGAIQEDEALAEEEGNYEKSHSIKSEVKDFIKTTFDQLRDDYEKQLAQSSDVLKIIEQLRFLNNFKDENFIETIIDSFGEQTKNNRALEFVLNVCESVKAHKDIEKALTKLARLHKRKIRDANSMFMVIDVYKKVYENKIGADKRTLMGELRAKTGLNSTKINEYLEVIRDAFEEIKTQVK